MRDPGSGGPWEWRTLGVVDPGSGGPWSGGPWEWRTATMGLCVKVSCLDGRGMVMVCLFVVVVVLVVRQ